MDMSLVQQSGKWSTMVFLKGRAGTRGQMVYFFYSSAKIGARLRKVKEMEGVSIDGSNF